MAALVEVGLLPAPRVPSHSKQRCVGGVAVETIRIKVLPCPLQERNDFFVPRVSGQASEEVLVATGSAAVFWRACSCAGLDIRGTVRFVDLLCLLDANDMYPAVAEVVLVLEGQAYFEHSVEADSSLVDDRQVVGIIVTRNAVTDPSNGEVVQMGISPTHRCLGDVMQLQQVHVSFNPHLPPDQRLDSSEFDVQPIAEQRLCRGSSRGGHERQAASRCSAPAMCEATVQGSNLCNALIGCSAMRLSTKRRYASGLRSFSLAVSSRV